VGTAVPGVLLGVAGLHRAAHLVPYLSVGAAIATLLGLFLYKYAYVRAGQLPPLS
jgi:hypothetical protein